MAIHLTEDHLRAAADSPIRITDPQTQQAYVLLRAEAYERLGQLLGDEFSLPEFYPAIDKAFSEGWNDPKMDDYDRYEDLKK